uniref:Fibrinogen C-terminal domain-containing protein n=1 Tax=Parascaris univalens TaxID=6257 RepID=A0A915ASW7_PARUN
MEYYTGSGGSRYLHEISLCWIFAYMFVVCASERNEAAREELYPHGGLQGSLQGRLASLESRVRALEDEKQTHSNEGQRQLGDRNRRPLLSAMRDDDGNIQKALTRTTYEETRDASVARDFVDDEPMNRRIANEMTAQRQSLALGNTPATVIHLDDVHAYSNEILTDTEDTPNVEREIRKINDKLRWIDFLLSRFQNELEHLKGGFTYKVFDESNDGASGEEGEYFYAIDGSMLGSGDDSDRNINDLYDRFAQLKETVETVMNRAYNTNSSGAGEPMTSEKNKSDLLRRIHELEAQRERDHELKLQEEKFQNERISSMESELIKTKSLVDKWMMVSEAMKRSHMRIFTALTEQLARYNSLQTNLVNIELKVAHLQVKVMNATHQGMKSSTSCDTTETAVRLKLDVDQMRKAFDVQRTIVDALSEKVSIKADERSVNDMRASLASANDKIEKLDSHLRNIVDNVNNNRNALRNLESSLPKACSDSLSTYGIYKDYLLIKPSDQLPSHIARCDGNWTIIQQRNDGATAFNRTFEEYRWPFGEVNHDHWIGNEYIHALTQPAGSSIRFETWDVFGEYRVALYHSFSVSDFTSLYRLSISGYDKEASNLTDAMSFHSGRRFSSLDRDEDSSSTHCARYYAAGWWFANCAKSNLNGNFHLGILWFDLQSGDWIHLRRTRISISTNDASVHYTTEHSTLIPTMDDV